MLDKKLVRTRYSDGLKISYHSFEKSDKYLEDKFRILSLGGLGYGVLQGYKDSLALSIEGNLLVIKSGAAIDGKGNLIYVPFTEKIKDKISVNSFLDHNYTYVYIKYEEEKSGRKEHVEQKETLEVHTEFMSSYKIVVSNYKWDDSVKSEYIELGRITIDYNKISEYGREDIAEPFNPFFPRDNEIDVRCVPRIITNLVNLKEDENNQVYRVLGKFSDYLNVIAFRYKLFSASVASSFVYQAREDIYMNIITPYDFYQKLKESVRIVEKIKEENSKIEDSDFWININNLKNLFSIGSGVKHNEKIDFYNFDISEKAYLGRILNHFKLAGECSRDLDFEVKEELVQEEPKHRGYVQIGRSDKEKHGNDIYLDFMHDQSVSAIHLIVTVENGGFWIEDQKSTNGTKINGIRIQPKEKKFVKRGDTVILGKNSKLNLSDTKIQELLNL